MAGLDDDVDEQLLQQILGTGAAPAAAADDAMTQEEELLLRDILAGPKTAHAQPPPRVQQKAPPPAAAAPTAAPATGPTTTPVAGRPAPIVAPTATASPDTAMSPNSKLEELLAAAPSAPAPAPAPARPTVVPPVEAQPPAQPPAPSVPASTGPPPSLTPPRQVTPTTAAPATAPVAPAPVVPTPVAKAPAPPTPAVPTTTAAAPSPAPAVAAPAVAAPRTAPVAKPSPTPPSNASLANGSVSNASVANTSVANASVATVQLGEECDAVQAMLSAMEAVPAGGAATTEASAVVGSALAHARRLAASGASDKASGQAVLRSFEVPRIGAEVAKARTTVGAASVIAASECDSATWAVGTTLGLVLLFRRSGEMNGVCGSVGIGTEARGTCVSLAVAPDASTVLAGYERGVVVLWSTSTLEPLKVLPSEFPAPTPVIRAAFLDPDPLKALVLDSGGNPRLLSFARIVSKMVCRAVDVPTTTSGALVADAAGTSRAVTDPVSHETVVEHFVAVVSSEELTVARIVLGLQSDAAVVFAHTAQRPSGPGGTETVAWQSRRGAPSLCVCWHTRVECFALMPTADAAQFVPTATIAVAAPLQSCAVLDGCCLLACDNQQTLHVVDTAAGAVAESVTLLAAEPLVFSSRACGMKYTGGVCGSGGHGYVLSKARLLSVSVLTWEARLDALVSLRQWEPALRLAQEFSTESAIAVVGLPEKPHERRVALEQYAVQLLTSFIADTMKARPPPAEVLALMRKVIRFCTDAHLEVQALFGPVSAFFDNLGSGSLFSLALEGALRGGDLEALPPSAVEPLCDFFTGPAVAEAEAMLPEPTLFARDPGPARVEAALMHVAGCDDALLAAAKARGLWRLVCLVWSKRRHQPEAAIVELTGLADAVLIDFVRATLDGTFIADHEPIPDLHAVPFAQRVVAALVEHPTALAALLSSNPTAMLAIVGDALRNHELWAKVSKSAPATTAPGGQATAYGKPVLLRRVWAAMLDDSCDERRPWLLERRPFTLQDQAPLLEMYLREVARDGVTFPDGPAASSFLTRAAFALAYHHNQVKELPVRQRLQAALSHVFTTPNTTVAAATAACLAEIERELASKRLGRPVAALRARRGDYAGGLSAYLEPAHTELDPSLAAGVFDFINAQLDATEADDAARAKLRAAVKQLLEPLVSVDATRLARLVFERLPEDHQEVLACLQGTHEAQFLYLREVLRTGGAAVTHDRELQTRFIGLLCMFDPGAVYDYLVANAGTVDYDLTAVTECCRHHNLVSACIFLYEKTFQIHDAMQLLLQSLLERVDACRNELIQDICAGSSDALQARLDAMLSGGTGDATMAVLAKGDAAVAAAPAAPESPEAGVEGQERAVAEMVAVGIGLCRRYQKHMDRAEQANVWFLLLDVFAKPKRVVADRLDRSHELETVATPGTPGSSASPFAQQGPADFEDELVVVRRHAAGTKPSMPQEPLSLRGRLFHETMLRFYTKHVGRVLGDMVQALDLRTVVAKVVGDNERDRFGPFKPVLVGILEKLDFDVIANELCKQCTEDDVLLLSADLRRAMCSAITPKGRGYCCLCMQHLSTPVQDFDNVKFFRCGHGFHACCVEGQSECPQCAVEARIGRDAADSVAAAASIGRAKAKAEPTAAPQPELVTGPPDYSRMQRRLRHTRLKLQGGRDYKDLLDRVVASSRGVGDLVRGARGGQLLLSPAPPDSDRRVAVETTHRQKLRPPPAATLRQFLSEADLEDIFGPEALYVAPPREPTPEPEEIAEAMGDVAAGDDEGEPNYDDLDW